MWQRYCACVGWGEFASGQLGEARTPLVEILVPSLGRLIPFLCALKFWLWLVWFLDLAISVSRVRGERGGGSHGRVLCVSGLRAPTPGNPLACPAPSSTQCSGANAQ